MTRRRSFTLAALASAALVFTACDESLATLAGPTPALDPTFSTIQREIFQTTDRAGRTACVTCHTPIGRLPPAGDMSLRPEVAYNNLVNAPSSGKGGAIRVIPGNPENSYLIHKLEGRAGIVGDRMPQDGPPYLTAGQIAIIKRWIELGAPNN